MNKLSSVALSAVLVVAGVGASVSAQAHPYVSVGIGLPGVAVVESFSYAPAYFAPYYYTHGRYWNRDYDRDRGDRFHHRRDHDGDHRWDRR
jgi:hypothetical protein